MSMAVWMMIVEFVSIYMICMRLHRSVCICMHPFKLILYVQFLFFHIYVSMYIDQSEDIK